MRWMGPILLGIVVLGACKQPPDPPSGDWDTYDIPECGGISPEIVELTATPDGLQDFSGETWPAVTVSSRFTDQDGDLHDVAWQLWIDSHADGALDSSGEPDREQDLVISENLCEVTNATITIHIAINGSLETNHWYDFGLRVADSDRLWSEVFVAQGGSPKEDGSDPDPP